MASVAYYVAMAFERNAEGDLVARSTHWNRKLIRPRSQALDRSHKRRLVRSHSPAPAIRTLENSRMRSCCSRPGTSLTTRW